MAGGVKAWAMAAALAAGPLAAGEAQDRIFRTGLLDAVETGQSLVYARERAGSLATASVPAIADGTVEVSVIADADGRSARVELRTGDQPTARTAMAAGGGHPVMLIFLETSARAMAELTGGSPFYIKNRMREALGDDVPVETVAVTVGGQAVAAEAVTFRPFADDPNRGKMGPFAELALTMVLSPEVPGAFARFEAVAGPGEDGAPAYQDTIAFERVK